MQNSQIRVLFSFFVIFTVLTTRPVLASVDGTFSGSTITDLTCSSPLITGGFPESTSLTIALSTGPSNGIVNSASISSAHFVFSTSSVGAYTDTTNPDGSIDLTGTINGSMNVTFGDTLIDGNYTTATFTFSALVSTSGSFELTSAVLTYSSTSLCSFGAIVFTSLPATFSGTIGGAVGGLLVDPAITAGSVITTSQTLKSTVGAIASDLQQRINDVFRTIKLARQRGGAEGFPGRIPPGGVPPDQRKKKKQDNEEDDSQAALPVERTQTGFMINALSGMNAGDTNALMGAWASYSYLDFSNDFAATSFDGRRHGGLAGIDISPREDLLLGLSVGYEDTNIDTDFNLGNQQTDGFTVAPYFGYLLTDTWSVSASVGYSGLNTDQFRTVPGTATRVTSSPDHRRWFGMVNLNGLTTYGNWVLGGQVGFLYALDAEEAFVESDGTRVAKMDSRLGQLNVGGEAAYSLGEYEPFARVSYEYDIKQTKVGVIGGPQPSFDEDDVLLGAGVRYYGTGGFTGNLEFNSRLGRDDYDEYSLMGTLRYEW